MSNVKTTIENWSIHDPEWVSIDLVKINGDKGGTIYAAMINVCLDEGDLESDNMQMITFMSGIAGSDYRQVVLRATAFADSLFGCPIVENVCLWEDGSVIAQGSALEPLNNLFEEDD